MNLDALMMDLLARARYSGLQACEWRLDPLTLDILKIEAGLGEFTQWGQGKSAFFGLNVVVEMRAMPGAVLQAERIVTLTCRQRSPHGRWIYLDADPATIPDRPFQQQET